MVPWSLNVFRSSVLLNLDCYKCQFFLLLALGLVIPLLELVSFLDKIFGYTIRIAIFIVIYLYKLFIFSLQLFILHLIFSYCLRFILLFIAKLEVH